LGAERYELEFWEYARLRDLAVKHCGGPGVVAEALEPWTVALKCLTDQMEVEPYVLTYPFVTSGGGAPKGLSPIEHLAWARMQQCESEGRMTSPDLWQALRHEIATPPEETQRVRESVVLLWQQKAAELEPLRGKFVRQADPATRPIVEKLHTIHPVAGRHDWV